MVDRTVIQWDKDDLESLGLLKVDVLGLGMLTAIRKALDLVNDFRGRASDDALTVARIPPEDPLTYAMLQHADSVGVFQVESRAQMSMLPRLKPENFYDLVIEVAIVRPGPIQGNMVHPYLRRRQGLEPVSYKTDGVRQVLERTLGVPIFQEQVIELAMVAAGFSGGEADRLRRAMAAWRRRGGLEHFEKKLVDGMLERGHDREFAERIFQQIKGFGEYGFPESHAASFALLVYVSAWLKRHEPGAFYCGLLNSLPMGSTPPRNSSRTRRPTASRSAQSTCRRAAGIIVWSRPIPSASQRAACDFRSRSRCSRRFASACARSRVSHGKRPTESPRRSRSWMPATSLAAPRSANRSWISSRVQAPSRDWRDTVIRPIGMRPASTARPPSGNPPTRTPRTAPRCASNVRPPATT